MCRPFRFNATTERRIGNENWIDWGAYSGKMRIVYEGVIYHITLNCILIME
jgi:hypothetical protein